MAPKIGKYDAKRANDLMRRIAGDSTDSGAIVNELLREFQMGYPLGNLLPLLHSSSDKLVGVGIWIVSELGIEARPLFDEVVKLLHHPSVKVRFFALDSLIGTCRSQDEDALFDALDLAEDIDSAVRWKALVFLATVSEEMLCAAKRVVDSRIPKSSQARGLELILSEDLSGKKIMGGLIEKDPVFRRYAAVAAARLARRNPFPLRNALLSEDPIIRDFATSMAKRLKMASDRISKH